MLLENEKTSLYTGGAEEGIISLAKRSSHEQLGIAGFGDPCDQCLKTFTKIMMHVQRFVVATSKTQAWGLNTNVNKLSSSPYGELWSLFTNSCPTYGLLASSRNATAYSKYWFSKICSSNQDHLPGNGGLHSTPMPPHNFNLGSLRYRHVCWQSVFQVWTVFSYVASRFSKLRKNSKREL